MSQLASVVRLTGLADEAAASLLSDHNGDVEAAVLAHHNADSSSRTGCSMLSSMLEVASEPATAPPASKEEAAARQEALEAYKRVVRKQTTPPPALRDKLPRPTVSLWGEMTDHDQLQDDAWLHAPVAFQTNDDAVVVVRPTEHKDTDISRITEARDKGKSVLVVCHPEGSQRVRSVMTPPLSPGETRRAAIAENGDVHTITDPAYLLELERCKEYQEAGASGFLLSPVYDLSSVLFHLDDLRAVGITIPCIPTVPVINDAKWVLMRCKAGKMRLPRGIKNHLEAARSDDDVSRYGTSLAGCMARQLFQRGAANVCLSVDSDSSPAQIARVLLCCGLAKTQAD